MFEYSSVQKRIFIVNEKGKGKGKGKEKAKVKINSVTIKGSKGKKEVKILNNSGRVTQKKSKKLTKKEIECIKKCRFIPGLFSDCESCLT